LFSGIFLFLICIYKDPLLQHVHLPNTHRIRDISTSSNLSRFAILRNTKLFVS